MKPIIIGTRGSALAQAQTRLVREELKRIWPQRTFETHIIRTKGDELSTTKVGGTPAHLDKGLFTAELEKALLEKKIDIAVHSLKDLPTGGTRGLKLGSIPKRGDAHDVLITHGPTSLAELPQRGYAVTGSARRASQIKLARPDVRVVDIRGNIDTRLTKFRETKEWSAMILAAAGLDRLKPSLAGLVVTPIPFEQMLPAPGQGALALQMRSDGDNFAELTAQLHDDTTAAAVMAERMFLEAMGGGCEEPIGALAHIGPDRLLNLEGIAWLPGETEPRRASLKRKATEAERLGVDLAVEISR